MPKGFLSFRDPGSADFLKKFETLAKNRRFLVIVADCIVESIVPQGALQSALRICSTVRRYDKKPPIFGQGLKFLEEIGGSRVSKA